MFRTAALLTLSLASPVDASDFSLAFPLDCTLGQDCYIQQYPDADPTDGARDYTCGALVYDGHKGTDIALPSLAALQAGVVVRAAASGIVRGIRNSVPDVLFGTPGGPDIDGLDCGNGLVLDHGDGWETQYCHMRLGSVSVQTGQMVETGDPLGLVGISGRTQFPHLHISVRHDGQVVDPFVPDGAVGCGVPTTDSLWLETPPYHPGGWITAGVAEGVPDYDAIKAGTAHTTVSGTPDALVIWGFGYGTLAGDVVAIEIAAPSRIIHYREVVLERPQAQMFRASGLRKPSNGWEPGAYRGSVSLIRDGAVIDTIALALTLP